MWARAQHSLRPARPAQHAGRQPLRCVRALPGNYVDRNLEPPVLLRYAALPGSCELLPYCTCVWYRRSVSNPKLSITGRKACRWEEREGGRREEASAWAMATRSAPRLETAHAASQPRPPCSGMRMCRSLQLLALTMKMGVPGLGTSAVTWPRRLASTV